MISSLCILHHTVVVQTTKEERQTSNKLPVLRSPTNADNLQLRSPGLRRSRLKVRHFPLLRSQDVKMMKRLNPFRPTSSTVSHTALFLFAIVIIANTLSITSITSNSQKKVLITEKTAIPCERRQPVEALSRVPDVFIFRKSKKTGSTSGLEAILRCLIPEGYTPLYNETSVVGDIVRAEAHKPSPRKLIVSNHNGISREHTGNRFTVIADTVKDGYQQITSFCRYMHGVEKCDSDEMRLCIRSSASRYQIRYRWTGREKEDSDTYIDLPLSVEHPALSATIFRRVFPHATLDIARNNVHGSSCEEIPSLRKIYDEHYPALDEQVLRLRKRILTLAGYPSVMTNFSVVQLLAAAERTEQAKYNLRGHEPTKHHGEFLLNVKSSSKSYRWYISKDSKLLLKDK